MSHALSDRTRQLSTIFLKNREYWYTRPMSQFEKKFDQWNQEKKSLELHPILRVHEGEISWCSLWVNVGDEEDGKNDFFERPVLVIRKFNNSIVWAIPMSTKIKDWIYYHTIEHDGVHFSLLLSQLRIVSTKRMRRYIRKIGSGAQDEIIRKITALLSI